MDAGDLLEMFDRQPRRRWPMLAQQARFQTPAVVTALLRRALAHRRTDHTLACAAAEAAATLTRSMPGEPALRAWALAELANSRRAGEDFETAAQLVREAETVLPEDAPPEIQGHVALVKAGVLRDLMAYDEAIVASRVAADAFRDLPYESVHALANLGLCLSQKRRFLPAVDAYNRALELLLRDQRIGEQMARGDVSREAYLRLVGLVQVNGLLVWVRKAEHEPDPERRRKLVDHVLRALDEIRRNSSEGLLERERIHFDWIQGRAMICTGFYLTAISMLERVRAHSESEGRFVQAAVVGNDLLFAHAARGDLETAAEEARKMLMTYRERDLPRAQLRLLEQMCAIRRRQAALSLLRGAAGIVSTAPDRARAILDF